MALELDTDLGAATDGLGAAPDPFQAPTVPATSAPALNWWRQDFAGSPLPPKPINPQDYLDTSPSRPLPGAPQDYNQPIPPSRPLPGGPKDYLQPLGGPVDLGKTAIDAPESGPGVQVAGGFEPHYGARGLVPLGQFRDALVARGIDPDVAAGITGNAAYESGGGARGVYLDPATDAGHRDWGTGDAAVGSMQWEGRRQGGVEPTLQSQVGHIYDELVSGKQGLTLDQLRGASPAQAAAMINARFERPLNPAASMRERQQLAQLAASSPGGSGWSEIKGPLPGDKAREAALSPQQKAYEDAVNAPLPKAPGAPNIPSYEQWKHQHNRDALKGMSAVFIGAAAAALIIGAAVGRKGGMGGKMALAGIAGFVNGTAAGEKEAAGKGLKQYKEAVAHLKEQYKEAREEFQRILEDRKLDISQKKEQLKIAAAKYDDHKAAEAVDKGDLKAIDKLHAKREKAVKDAEDAGKKMDEFHTQFEYNLHEPDTKKELTAANKDFNSAMRAYGSAQKALQTAIKSGDPQLIQAAREQMALARQAVIDAKQRGDDVVLGARGGRRGGEMQGPEQAVRGTEQEGPPMPPQEEKPAGGNWWDRFIPSWLGGKPKEAAPAAPATPAPGAPAPSSGAGASALDQARQAIAAGAPRDKVIERLKQNGIDPSGL